MRKQTIIFVSVLLLLFGGPFVAYSAEGITYIVQPGDDLVKLSGEYLGNGAHYRAIFSATNDKHDSDSSFAKITDPFDVKPGWKLFIPAAGIDQEDYRISIVVGGLGFPEAPIWDSKRETLYWVEWSGDAIWAMKDGRANVAIKTKKGEGPNGLILDKDGNLWVCMYSSLEVVKMTPSGKVLQTIDNYNGKPFLGPNDFAMDANGGLYITDSGNFGVSADDDFSTGRPVGAIYYLTPKGKLLQVAKDISYANGLVISHDGKSLIVAEHRRNCLLKYSINPDGTLSNKAVFFNMDTDCAVKADLCWIIGPDGLKIDSKGNIWIAQLAGGKIVVVSPEGKLLRKIFLPKDGGGPTNVAFTPDEKTLYVTDGLLGLLYRIQFK